VLTISSGNSVTLADTNTDTQTLSLAGNVLAISGGNSVTLTQTDSQTLSLSGQVLTISSGNSVTLADTNTDSQTINAALAGTTLQLRPENTTTSATVDLSSFTNTDSQTIAAALNGTTLELRPENITTASITVDLSSLAVTPTLDQVTDVGSITTNNIQVGDLTTTGLTVGNYTFPASNTFGANVALVSTATDTIGFRPFVNIPFGTNDGDILFWNSLGANWERTDILKVPISGAIEVDETFRPRTNGDKLLGTSSYVFSETYSKAFRSGSSAMEIKTGVTSGFNPALSILESSTLVAGVALQTFFIGDLPGGTGYSFPTTKGSSNQVLTATGGTNVLFEDISTLERQTLDDVVTLGNSTTSTVNLGTTNIDGELHASGGNHSIGDSTTDEDIDIGGSTDDTVSIIGKINQSVLVSGTVEFGDSTNNISTVYTQDIRSNNVSLTLQTTGSGANIVFKPETIEVAGVTSQTFYIGDAAASDRYEFPSNAPATVGNQVLAYTSSNTLTFIDSSSTDSQTLADVTLQGTQTTDVIQVAGIEDTSLGNTNELIYVGSNKRLSSSSSLTLNPTNGDIIITGTLSATNIDVTGTITTSADLNVKGDSRFEGEIATTDADLTFEDKKGVFPTSGKGFFWSLNNDNAKIYAVQPASDAIDFYFNLADNTNNTTDRYIFWHRHYGTNLNDDRFPLVMNSDYFYVFADPSSTEAIPDLSDRAMRVSRWGDVEIKDDLTVSGDLTVGGSGTVGGSAITSDIRLKSNIEPSPYGLGAVIALQPKIYLKFKTPAKEILIQKEIGFIAQEVNEIIPEIVRESFDKTGILSLNYNAFIPVLTKAIQEQQEQIEAQQRQLNTQATEIETLKTLVQQLINKQK
ncbi:MAG: tail fiber domain-containing protein, partial [Flavobacteriaceae bacterium]